MWIGLFVIGAFGVLCAAGSLVWMWWLHHEGFRWRSCPRYVFLHRFAPMRSVCLVGGARIGWLSFSRLSSRLNFVTTTLTIDEAYAFLQVEQVVMRIPPVWIPRTAVVSVRRVRLPIASGVRFETTSGVFDGLLFVTSSDRYTFDVLRHFGWPVVG
jgi:hypothetical protein